MARMRYERYRGGQRVSYAAVDGDLDRSMGLLQSPLQSPLPWDTSSDLTWKRML